MNDPKTLIDRYIAAAEALDADALIALYAPDLRLFDLMTPWQRTSADEWRAGIDDWFQHTGDDPKLTASQIEVKQTEGMALLTMVMEYTHVENGKRVGMPNRLTWVAVPDGGDWLIVHEHTSVPLQEPEMTPQFNLDESE